eukprot:TRINITY_DN34148_c2_g1_i1.p1 TRINITY_DN34148_c2_g1~~TRINITY_DN34148_c2_g1_i1.p1  ORF type:complete len:140 (-),score=6.22 TRINITY_DN34148_c2_g1_i1:495-881(-)
MSYVNEQINHQKYFVVEVAKNKDKKKKKERFPRVVLSPHAKQNINHDIKTFIRTKNKQIQISLNKIIVLHTETQILQTKHQKNNNPAKTSFQPTSKKSSNQYFNIFRISQFPCSFCLRKLFIIFPEKC